MLNLNLTAFQSQEFIVGIAVAAILICALCASSMFRNIALALAAGGVVLLYLQGGVPALISTSSVLEKEIRALPDFSNGLVVGLAVSAVLLLGVQRVRPEGCLGIGDQDRAQGGTRAIHCRDAPQICRC